MKTVGPKERYVPNETYGYGEGAPELGSSNSADPRWSDICTSCGYARINQRHGPPPRTQALPGTVEECVFKGANW